MVVPCVDEEPGNFVDWMDRGRVSLVGDPRALCARAVVVGELELKRSWASIAPGLFALRCPDRIA